MLEGKKRNIVKNTAITRLYPLRLCLCKEGSDLLKKPYLFESLSVMIQPFLRFNPALITCKVMSQQTDGSESLEAQKAFLEEGPGRLSINLITSPAQKDTGHWKLMKRFWFVPYSMLNNQSDVIYNFLLFEPLPRLAKCGQVSLPERPCSFGDCCTAEARYQVSERLSNANAAGTSYRVLEKWKTVLRLVSQLSLSSSSRKWSLLVSATAWVKQKLGRSRSKFEQRGNMYAQTALKHDDDKAISDNERRCNCSWREMRRYIR